MGRLDQSETTASQKTGVKKKPSLVYQIACDVAGDPIISLSSLIPKFQISNPLQPTKGQQCTCNSFGVVDVCG
ncbi:unnamed protein product [Spodoptera exigua]|nr:unnamed protein product [Spodoptera exigua]